MPESLLTILKFAFLALLYLFFLRVVRAVCAELREPKPVPVAAGPTVAGAAPTGPATTGGPPPPQAEGGDPASRPRPGVQVGDEVTPGPAGGCGNSAARATHAAPTALPPHHP